MLEEPIELNAKKFEQKLKIFKRIQGFGIRHWFKRIHES